MSGGNMGPCVARASRRAVRISFALLVVIAPLLAPIARAQEDPFTATFVNPRGNNWWVETDVVASHPLDGVDARVNGGAWQPLEATAWGSWAASFFVPTSSAVEFRARSTTGESVVSVPYLWPDATPIADPGTTPFEALFVDVRGNIWWIETEVEANAPLAGVDTRLDGGPWQALSATSWGSWAESLFAPAGTIVEFRARSIYGDEVVSGRYLWPDAVLIEDPPPPPPPPPPPTGLVVELKADTTTLELPDGTVVTMWGFGPLDGDVTVPGPRLTVPPGTTSLTVHLTNLLSVPVSILIPGQPAPLEPVRFTDAQGRERVRSLTAETAPRETRTYTWEGLKPGTYLYHSGTHPAVQVQMGLYGAMTKDALEGEAYEGVPYDDEALVLYSEIDPALHAAVADGTYGTPAYPSTLDYAPKYFLINGRSFPDVAPLLDAPPAAGDRVLLRLVNAGLESHVPALKGPYMTLVAEDGSPYRHPREQFAALLPAGKTTDAVLVAAGPGDVALYDRALRLTNAGASGGGMLAFVSFTAPLVAPSSSRSLLDRFDGRARVRPSGLLPRDGLRGPVRLRVKPQTLPPPPPPPGE